MGTQLPYPIQPQGMPLPYTLPRAGPYPASYMSAPPMPTAYNPYATMHYPPQGTLLLFFFFFCILDIVNLIPVQNIYITLLLLLVNCNIIIITLK